TYRIPRESFAQLDHRFPDSDGHDGSTMGNGWVAGKSRYPAYARGRLEAKLIEGDEKGKVLARCTSEISRDATNGYVYGYAVENLTDKPLKFKWAGLEGTVDPKKS